MRYILLHTILFTFLINAAFSSDLSVIQTNKISQIQLALADNKLDLRSFKINLAGRILNQPIILTPENLGEWGKIYFEVIPPDNYSSTLSIDISIDAVTFRKTSKNSFYFEFEPEDNKTYIITMRVLTNDNAEIRTFREYPITFIRFPEKHYSQLIKNIITIAFNNKDPSAFLKHLSNTYTDPENNRYDEIEDKLNLEFKKYSNIKFTIKNFEISRLDSVKFKVTFEWTKSYEKNDGNNIENIFGKSIFIFENDLIIQTSGDSIFMDSSVNKQLSANSGVLKGGTVNLTPNESFEFLTETFYKNDRFKGDIAVKKDGNFLSLYVPGGVIQDMGITALSEIKEAPETGYSEETQVIIGHSYCLRNNNNRFAKLQITYVEGSEIGQTSVLVSINWIYQEKECRILRPQ
ncbi:MAG: hypothetical protein PHX78_00705 [bacterium]|nr:hypothetical protein [bacterium]